MLHNLGIVWGDVKSDNILVDKSSNAVLIDFEGGSTRYWVDKGKAGTVEGDLQGLEKLMDYIFNDASTLRPNPDREESVDDEEIDEMR